MLACYREGFRASGRRPEIGQLSREMAFLLAGKIETFAPPILENTQPQRQSSVYLPVWKLLPVFQWKPQATSRAVFLFSCFGAEARKPLCSRRACSQPWWPLGHDARNVFVWRPKSASEILCKSFYLKRNRFLPWDAFCPPYFSELCLCVEVDSAGSMNLQGVWLD